ncbi:hypothetical protein LCL89_12180 [Halobacillus yeomjeoni]|nr:hypothetical protein [Halobacillus yeomjeoni]MCA0984806.1 hypothetical protein [Halobacillus yeomjeoni]
MLSLTVLITFLALYSIDKLVTRLKKVEYKSSKPEFTPEMEFSRPNHY